MKKKWKLIKNQVLLKLYQTQVRKLPNLVFFVKKLNFFFFFSDLVDLLLNKQQAWTDDLDLAAIDSEFQDYAEKMELIEIINGLQYNHFTTEADSSLAFPTVSDSSPSFVSADQSMSHHLHSYSNGTTYSTPSPPSPLHSLIPDLSLLNQPQIVLETPVLNETSPAHQIITPNSSFSDLNSPQAEPSPISKTEQSKPAASSRIKSSLVQSGRRWADVLASNSSPSPQNPEKNEKAITAAPTPKNENASVRFFFFVSHKFVFFSFSNLIQFHYRLAKTILMLMLMLILILILKHKNRHWLRSILQTLIGMCRS